MVPGTLSDSIIRNKPVSGDCRLIVKVSREQWEATNRIRQQWANKKFGLKKRDCVSFAAEVGAQLALHVPERTGLENIPTMFIRKIAEAKLCGQTD